MVLKRFRGGSQMTQPGTAALSWLEDIGNGRFVRDYESFYGDSKKETLTGLYSIREAPIEGGKPIPIETVSQIVSRVADAIAIAELAYCMTPQEIIDLEIQDALAHPEVQKWSDIFAEMIGRQYFWLNTPANINADPVASLMVLQYEAYGKLADLSIDDIWGKQLEYEGLDKRFEGQEIPADSAWYGDEGNLQLAMGKTALKLKGRGCLAACGVNYIRDTLEGIQDASSRSVLAAKNAMGFGVNTSNLRPWSSPVANGAAASGPDRFYQKYISSCVDALAQGGRRGGALIEWRDSNHPDILFFIDKKRIPKVPSIGDLLSSNIKDEKDSQKALYLAIHAHSAMFHRYMQQQEYLDNTNISVLVMPGFMDAVMEQSFYRARWDGKDWNGKVYDPRRPRIKGGVQEIDELTKELIFEEYSVDLTKYRSEE